MKGDTPEIAAEAHLSGRGVGLSAVRAEAERLGGQAAITSQPGRGMCLVVTVPLARQPE